MLVALDLTPRQAARVLYQAVRDRTKLELEPRPEAARTLLWGTLVGNRPEVLQVDLHDQEHEQPLAGLIGAMCDVRMCVAGQLYLFSTFVLEVSDGTVPHRLTLAAPETIQVANRRRHARLSPLEAVPVRLGVGGTMKPVLAELANIGPRGLGCRIGAGEDAGLFYIGDPVAVEFALPWSSEVFALSAVICNKGPSSEPAHVLVGLEFSAEDAAARAALERLRTALLSETARLCEAGGES